MDKKKIKEMRDKVKEMRKKRFQFLLRLYELSEVEGYKAFNEVKFGEELGFDKPLILKIKGYLRVEQLIQLGSLGGVGIAHKGIKTVEEALVQGGPWVVE